MIVSFQTTTDISKYKKTSSLITETAPVSCFFLYSVSYMNSLYVSCNCLTSPWTGILYHLLFYTFMFLPKKESYSSDCQNHKHEWNLCVHICKCRYWSVLCIYKWNGCIGFYCSCSIRLTADLPLLFYNAPHVLGYNQSHLSVHTPLAKKM